MPRVIIVGASVGGSIAADTLRDLGVEVVLLERDLNYIKPCGGAVPPQLLRDFDVPESLLVAHIDTARIISPKSRRVDIPVGDGFVGMVARDVFDEWLRTRAANAGAERRTGTFTQFTRGEDGVAVIRRELREPAGRSPAAA